MENKICVYAICKNESQFVERWLSSMSEADYIVVVDTGSTDDTFELLMKDDRVYDCERQIIDPWRFDVARNESLILAYRTDANIFVCTDFDEILDPGWADALRSNWNDGFTERAMYKYAWSHNDNGEPERIFYYDKIHSRKWKWAAPVHEYLTPIETYDELNDPDYISIRTVDLFNEGVYLHHFPDRNKSRESYLPLLELRAKEDPNDYNGLYYYAHELYYRGYYEKSIAILDTILTDDRFEGDRTDLEVAACYLFMGDSFFKLGKPEAAISAYNSAISADRTYREPYLQMAEVYQELGYHHIAIGIVKEALKKSTRHFTWLERDISWREQPYDILSISEYYVGDYKNSYINAIRALDYNASDLRLLENARLAREALIANE